MTEIRSSLNSPQGNWIVHKIHGAGCIKGSMVSVISGEAIEYHEFQTMDRTVWIPADKLSDDSMRPLATRSTIKEATEVLQRPPRQMDKDFKKRRQRIIQVQNGDQFIEIARLIRDLRGRQRAKPLNNTEKDALLDLTKRLLQEWALCRGIKVDSARIRLDALLQMSRESV